MLWVAQAQTLVLSRLRRDRFVVVEDCITWRLPTRNYRGSSSTSRANHTMPVVRSKWLPTRRDYNRFNDCLLRGFQILQVM
jgi:hypothetical protein